MCAQTVVRALACWQSLTCPSRSSSRFWATFFWLVSWVRVELRVLNSVWNRNVDRRLEVKMININLQTVGLGVLGWYLIFLILNLSLKHHFLLSAKCDINLTDLVNIEPAAKLGSLWPSPPALDYYKLICWARLHPRLPLVSSREESCLESAGRADPSLPASGGSSTYRGRTARGSASPPAWCRTGSRCGPGCSAAARSGGEGSWSPHPRRSRPCRCQFVWRAPRTSVCPQRWPPREQPGSCWRLLRAERRRRISWVKRIIGKYFKIIMIK